MADYRYPYPDFIQVIYAGQPDQFKPEAMQEDIYVFDSAFHPVSDLQAFQLVQSDLCYLEAAQQALRPDEA